MRPAAIHAETRARKAGIATAAVGLIGWGESNGRGGSSVVIWDLLSIRHPNAPALRFIPYEAHRPGFFVPIDSAGATAVMEGVFSVKTIPEATAKHYASETPGGKHDAIKGDQKELSLVASGVELARPGR